MLKSSGAAVPDQEVRGETMYNHPDNLLRITQDKMQDFQREAATARQLPSFRQRLASGLIKVARWLEPEVESAPTPELLSR